MKTVWIIVASVVIILIICCIVVSIAAQFIRVLTPQEVTGWCSNCSGVFMHTTHEWNYDVIEYEGDNCNGSFNIPDRTEIGAHITYTITTPQEQITDSGENKFSHVCSAVFIATH